MCKIFAMTNMEQVDLTPKFIRTVRDEVCKLSDKDGFGYAVLDKDGNIGGERTMRPFNFKPLDDDFDAKVVAKLPIVLKTRNRFGTTKTVVAGKGKKGLETLKVDRPKSFIAHGRLSTNNVSLANTHPFTNGEIALIHNGIVHDPDKNIKNLSTNCDSEILLRYWERGGIRDIETNVTGYYALAVLDKQFLHIVRDDRAMLHITYCRTINSYLIATTQDIIKNVAKRMRWLIEAPEEINTNTYAVFDGNEIVLNESIMTRLDEGKGWMNYGKAAAALGVHYNDLDAEDETPPSYREICEQEDYQEGRVGKGKLITRISQNLGAAPSVDSEALPDDNIDPNDLPDFASDDTPQGEYDSESTQDLVDMLESQTTHRHYNRVR